jgi:hypothetical protein
VTKRGFNWALGWQQVPPRQLFQARRPTPLEPSRSSLRHRPGFTGLVFASLRAAGLGIDCGGRDQSRPSQAALDFTREGPGPAVAMKKRLALKTKTA